MLNLHSRKLFILPFNFLLVRCYQRRSLRLINQDKLLELVQKHAKFLSRIVVFSINFGQFFLNFLMLSD